MKSPQDYAEEIRKAKETGLVSFMTWFNKPERSERFFEEAELDFETQILTSKIKNLLGDTHDKTALEIGYGGGRLMNAACARFKQVIGIDVHNEAETVKAILNSRGKKNLELKKTCGNVIGTEPNSIDFIYSFIVFQHLPTFDVFKNYLNEIYRCLKPDGIAQIYYGSFCGLSILKKIQYFRRQYLEIDAPVNHTSLIIRKSMAIRIAEAIGFRVFDTGHTYKTYPIERGGQEYMSLMKK